MNEKMIVVEVNEMDVDKVFNILINNGRFAGLSQNRFRIEEHADEVIKKIKAAGIQFKIIEQP